MKPSITFKTLETLAQEYLQKIGISKVQYTNAPPVELAEPAPPFNHFEFVSLIADTDPEELTIDGETMGIITISIASNGHLTFNTNAVTSFEIQREYVLELSGQRFRVKHLNSFEQEHTFDVLNRFFPVLASARVSIIPATTDALTMGVFGADRTRGLLQITIVTNPACGSDFLNYCADEGREFFNQKNPAAVRISTVSVSQVFHGQIDAQMAISVIFSADYDR